MTVHGTLKADGLTVAKITVDFLQNPVKVHALAALVHTGSGQTFGWTEGSGAAFSTDTMQKLQELRESMERDIARSAFAEGAVEDSVSASTGLRVGGLGEHLGGNAEPPSI